MRTTSPSPLAVAWKETPFEEQEVLDMLVACEAIIRDDHFVLTPKEFPSGSGVLRFYHSNGYICKDRLFEAAGIYRRLAREICLKVMSNLNPCPDYVVGPEKGAIALACIVAGLLSEYCGKSVKAMYAEKNHDGGFSISRGFDRDLPGHTVLVVEDIVNSGTTLRGTIKAVEKAGGRAVAMVSICSWGQAEIAGIPFFTLCTIQGFNKWLEEECPICADSSRGPRSVRLDVNSHGREFLKRLGLA